MSLDTISAREEQYLCSIPKLPIDKICGRIADGAQNAVFGAQKDVPHGISHVLKAPLCYVRRDVYSQTLGRVFGQSYSSAERELDMAQKYFGKFLVETEICRNPNGYEFVMVQPAIDVDLLTPMKLLLHPVLNDKLEQLNEQNRKMMRDEGKFMDVMGWNFGKYREFLRGTPYFENVSVSRDADGTPNDLELFDVGMFPVPCIANPTMILQYLSQKKNMELLNHTFA